MKVKAPRARNAAAITVLAATVATGSAPAYEGMRLVAYRDPVGIPTICAGRTTGVKMGDRATHEQCMKWLGEEMYEAVLQVRKCHPTVDFSANQLAAYGDMIYNAGPTAICSAKDSTMARLLYAGKPAEACAQLPRWNKARVAGILVPLPGLTKRRTDYMVRCQTPDPE